MAASVLWRRRKPLPRMPPTGAPLRKVSGGTAGAGTLKPETSPTTRFSSADSEFGAPRPAQRRRHRPQVARAAGLPGNNDGLAPELSASPDSGAGWTRPRPTPARAPPQRNPPLPPDPGLPAPSPVPPQPEPPMPGPVTYNPADAAANRHQTPGPLAAPSSDEMPRPEGLAFDVEPV